MIKLLKDKIPPSFIEKKGSVYTFINPYSYLLARSQEDLFTKITNIYLDGFLMVKLLSMLGLVRTVRLSFDFSSIAESVFQNAAESNSSIYILGTKKEMLGVAINNIIELFPDLDIIGYRDGYFANNQELIEEINKISSLNPDYVVCGMGTPLQEQFLIKLKENGWSGIGYTCGGFLHQTQRRSNIIQVGSINST